MQALRKHAAAAGRYVLLPLLLSIMVEDGETMKLGKRKDRSEWFRWFAWYPVDLEEGHKVWLEWVWRKERLVMGSAPEPQLYTWHTQDDGHVENSLWWRKTGGNNKR